MPVVNIPTQADYSTAGSGGPVSGSMRKKGEIVGEKGKWMKPKTSLDGLTYPQKSDMAGRSLQKPTGLSLGA